MGRPKKSKAAIVANLNKKKVSAKNETKNESKDEYASKLNNSSTCSVKSNTHNVKEVIVNVSDACGKISYEKTNDSYTPEAIYLHHKNENHYEVVEDVEREEPIVIDDKETQLSVIKSCKKKRGNKWCQSKKRTTYFKDYNVDKRKMRPKIELNVKHVFRIIYRPPKYRLELFKPHLEHFLTELQQCGYDYIVMGDFNQNLLEGYSSIRHCFEEFGFRQCVTDSTTECNSLLDHEKLEYDHQKMMGRGDHLPLCKNYYGSNFVDIIVR
ncbi:hypothetical protein LOTGIDRAFT_155000 [Lottia gigantea]|uniref:Endonuclease/exonuclease/phosphatase domain-containing protein n=1 Tax=Lottia gigantea TaxID=225164 RepID=V3Z4C0_LOTGI|nr:hypothetical protein LOTGIDRAFT_155000 [Lottia gigantea]ESO85513.1 hypothetical protein LOTGIDRAFT_155000 [Lottia gigantea]